jgi:polyhydroxybutyrate depolymerase
MRGRIRAMLRLGLILMGAMLTWQGVLTSANAQAALKQPGDHDVVIIVGKLKRHFILHVPTSYRDSKAVPLVVMLHGHGGTGKAMSKVGWSEQADKDTFLVAYPDAQRPNPDQPPSKDNVPTWNDGSGRDGINASVDDVGFIKALLGFVSTKLSVDPQRLYLAGFSQGGVTTFNLGVALSDELAAIGVASAPFAPKDDSTPKLAHPLPLVFIIGTADKLNPIDGGEAPNSLTGGTRTAPPVQDTIDAWLALNACSATPTVMLDQNGVHGQAYVCQPNFELDYYTIDGMGHTWSLGPRPGSGDLPENKLSGVQTMWEFFSKFTLSGAMPQN